MTPFPDKIVAHRAALRQLVQSGRFTAGELADVACCSESALYKAMSCREEDADLSAEKYVRIALYTASHGDTRLAEALVPPGYRILPPRACLVDGSLADELHDIAENLGRAVVGFDMLDRQEALKAAKALHVAVERMVAEIENLS